MSAQPPKETITSRDRQRAWQSAIDAAITEAAARGAFDDLPGKGKPLVWDTETDDDMWLANHMLKGQGFKPAWIERLKDIETERAALAERIERFAADWTSPGVAAAASPALDAALGRLEAEVTRRIQALNRLIDAHNIDLGGDRAPQRRLVVQDVMAGLRTRLGR